MTIPTRGGFYWAQWMVAEEGTRHGDVLTPSNGWDVVYVYENDIDRNNPEFLRVLVVGVEASQSLQNFNWAPPGPLAPPVFP